MFRYYAQSSFKETDHNTEEIDVKNKGVGSKKPESIKSTTDSFHTADSFYYAQGSFEDTQRHMEHMLQTNAMKSSSKVLQPEVTTHIRSSKVPIECHQDRTTVPS